VGSQGLTAAFLQMRRYACCCCSADLYFKSYGTVARGNPNYFITYGNGKSGEADGLTFSVNLDPHPFSCRQGTFHECYHTLIDRVLTPSSLMPAAARVQQGMRPNGAHRWHSYVKTPK
jgi:hypothetical protein